MSLLPLLLLACLVSPEPGGGEGPDGGGADGGGADSGLDGGADGGTDSGQDSGWWKQDPGDADGDGYTVEQGDCDDGDEDIHPGAPDDDCDGQDQDCDEAADEEFDQDPFEPNDSSGVDVGDLETEGEVLIVAWLWPEGDEDRYLFYVEDGDWDWFDIELWLYDVPGGADYALELELVADMDGDPGGVVDRADEEGSGGEELINYGGEYGFDDSGWYEAVVRGEGSGDCGSPYTLQILAGSW